MPTDYAVAGYRPGGRRQRPAGARRLQLGGQRRHIRPAVAGEGDRSDADGGPWSAAGARARRVHACQSPPATLDLHAAAGDGHSCTGVAAAGARPYLVAGKTGTAQIPSTTAAGYVTGAYNATFVGFAPATNPDLSAIVTLDHPDPIYESGAVAAPVFAQIMHVRACIATTSRPHLPERQAAGAGAPAHWSNWSTGNRREAATIGRGASPHRVAGPPSVVRLTWT